MLEDLTLKRLLQSIGLSTKPRIIENVIVRSDFKRHNYSVSALRRSRRAAYEM